MSSLIEIQKQIELLQEQAKEIKKREFKDAIEEIRAKMLSFGITPADLQAEFGRTKARRVSSSAGKSVVPKFRGPQGETWSGRGLKPRWLSTLLAKGHRLEEFAV